MKEIKYPISFTITQCFYVQGWCKYCGTGFDEQYFSTLEETMEYLSKDPFICWDCEQEIGKKLRRKNEVPKV